MHSELSDRVRTLERDVAELKRQMKAIVDSFQSPSAASSSSSSPPVPLRKETSKGGLEFIQAGKGIDNDNFATVVRNVKKVLGNVNANCAIYIHFVAGARPDLKSLPRPVKTPAVGIYLALMGGVLPDGTVDGVKFFQLQADDTALGVRNNTFNSRQIERMIAYIKQAAIGSTLNSFWD